MNNVVQHLIKLVDLSAQQARIRERVDAAIARVLAHGQYIMGPEVRRLELELAAFAGAGHAVSCASGTDALLIAMMALGIGRGDAVLCPAFTYTATPETVALLGATPVFVDVDETFNLSIGGLEAGLSVSRREGLRAAAIIAVDLFGVPADYQRLEPFACAEGLTLICDAAQSFGASVNGVRVGSFGRITATSFFPSKPLGCYGDGGALLTGDAELAALLESIRLHGKAAGDDKYKIERIGVNGRLDTLQAAILLEKLTIFDDELRCRAAIAQRYSEGLSDCVLTPEVPDGYQSAWAQYTIRVNANKRSDILSFLLDEGVQTAVYYPRPLHLQPAYAGFPVAVGGVPMAERLSNQVLSLPMHPYLTAAEQDHVIRSLQSAIRASK